MFPGTGTGYTGSCRLANHADRTAVECEFDRGADSLRMTGDLPPLPDPRSDPSLAWLEATYTFKGDYRADEVVEFVGAEQWFFVIPLADGGIRTSRRVRTLTARWPGSHCQGRVIQRTNGCQSSKRRRLAPASRRSVTAHATEP